jgi:hypothetical protein
MKNMQEEAKQMSADPVMKEGPRYPYGLQIHLDEGSLKKLGIKELPKVGDVMTIKAKVSVCDVNKHESIYGSNRNLGLQITDMELSSKGE